MDKVEQFKEIADSLSVLYAKKNEDYGDSFGKTFEELGIISAVTRMSDKMNRIKNLAVNNSSNFESIEDNLKDIASYAIMTLIELENENKDKEKIGARCCSAFIPYTIPT